MNKNDEEQYSAEQISGEFPIGTYANGSPRYYGEPSDEEINLKKEEAGKKTEIELNDVLEEERGIELEVTKEKEKGKIAKAYNNFKEGIKGKYDTNISFDLDLEEFELKKTILGYKFSNQEYNNLIDGNWSDVISIKNKKEEVKAKIKLIHSEEGKLSIYSIPVKEKFDKSRLNINADQMESIVNDEYIKFNNTGSKSCFGKYDSSVKDVVFYSEFELNIPKRIGQKTIDESMKLELLNKGKIENFKITHLNNDFIVDLVYDEKKGITFDNEKIDFIRNPKEFENTKGLHEKNVVTYKGDINKELELAIQKKDFDKMRSLTVDNNIKVSDETLMKYIIKDKEYKSLETKKAFACLGVDPEKIAEKQKTLMEKDKKDSQSLTERLEGTKPKDQELEKLKGYTKDVAQGLGGLVKDI